MKNAKKPDSWFQTLAVRGPNNRNDESVGILGKKLLSPRADAVIKATLKTVFLFEVFTQIATQDIVNERERIYQPTVGAPKEISKLLSVSQ